MTRVVVLHSGGMDSTVCLYKGKAEGLDVHSLGIDYGQRLSIEMQFAAEQCAKLGVPREVICVAWRKPERSIPTHRVVADMPRSISPAFLPGRNVVFLSIAVAHAAGLAADQIHIGLNCVDFSGYPDCTAEFLDAFRSMISIASPGAPEIHAPLLTMSKPDIARMATSLGIGEHDTWSCYCPNLVDGSVSRCGVCDACRLHDYAWQAVR